MHPWNKRPWVIFLKKQKSLSVQPHADLSARLSQTLTVFGQSPENVLGKSSKLRQGVNVMPEAKIKARGGAKRWRTKKLPGGKYIHVAVVPQAGPHGGHTISGEVHKKKQAVPV
jgi:hypothetical protein